MNSKTNYQTTDLLLSDQVDSSQIIESLTNKKKLRRRGPRFTRLEPKSTSLLRRWVSMIFGDSHSKKPSFSEERAIQTESTEKIYRKLNDSQWTLLTQVNTNMVDVNEFDRITQTNKIKRSMKIDRTLKKRKSNRRTEMVQFNQTETSIECSPTDSESSWLDLMREDKMTIEAWSRIRRRLKPDQQKDILR